MKHIQTKLQITIITVVLLPFILFSIFCTGGGVRNARAAVTARSAYESTDVMTDLKNSVIDGKPFDLSRYKFNDAELTQVLSFAEFGYPYYADQSEDYGLYLYIYNPRGINYDLTSPLNRVTMRYDGRMSYFYKLDLKLLSQSTDPGAEGLFYKFRIELSNSRRADMLKHLNSAERIYEISEIELYNSTSGRTEAYTVSKTYKYTGYAKGYGSISSDGSDLRCTSEGSTTLELEVHPATYRPEGTNGNSYTQDSLDSVYFSVPNNIISEYGGMSAVHAAWLDATTSPILVTGNREVYNNVYQSVHANHGSPSDSLEYAFLTNAMKLSITSFRNWSGDIAYYYSSVGTPLDFMNFVFAKETLDKLYYLFYADNNDADNYTLKGGDLLQYMIDYAAEQGLQSSVAGKYARELFADVAEEYTDITIKATDSYDLKSEKLGSYWWEKLFGKNHVESVEVFENIEAIHPVVPDDFKQNAADTCKGLYIDEAYYEDFKAFYDLASSRNETVYIFRYYLGKYESREVTTLVARGSGPEAVDTNAYLASETLHLDFDIIDITCTKGDVDTVIGVVSSPQDIAPDITPPVYTVSDKRQVSLLAILATIALVILVVWLVFKLINLFPDKKE